MGLGFGKRFGVGKEVGVRMGIREKDGVGEEVGVRFRKKVGVGG